MKITKRREFIKNLGITAAGVAVFPALTSCNTETEDKKVHASYLQERAALKKYSNKVKKLVNETTCIDMLGHFGDFITQRKGMSLDTYWTTIPGSFTKEDYQFVRDAGINVFGYGDMRPTYEGTLQFIAEQNGIIASNPDYFQRIDTKAKLKNLLDTKVIIPTSLDSPAAIV